MALTVANRCSAGKRHSSFSATRPARQVSVTVKAHHNDTSQHQVTSRRALLAVAGISSAGLAGLPVLPASAKLKDYNVTPGSDIEEVNVSLGTTDNEFAFQPNNLEFTQGKIYRLNLTNPSSLTHYFTALEFADKVYSILVLAGDPAVEVKGGIREVALKSGASATWIFMPIKPGKYPLRCTVKGHEAMQGTITIKPAAA